MDVDESDSDEVRRPCRVRCGLGQSEGEDEDAEPAPAAGKKRRTSEAAKPAAKKAKVAPTTPGESEVKTVFVGQLSWNVDNDWLKSEFEDAGTVVSARVVTERDSGRSKGFGYVEFEAAAGAQAALEYTGKEIDG